MYGIAIRLRNDKFSIGHRLYSIHLWNLTLWFWWASKSRNVHNHLGQIKQFDQVWNTARLHLSKPRCPQTTGTRMRNNKTRSQCCMWCTWRSSRPKGGVRREIVREQKLWKSSALCTRSVSEVSLNEVYKRTEMPKRKLKSSDQTHHVRLSRSPVYLWLGSTASSRLPARLHDICTNADMHFW